MLRMWDGNGFDDFSDGIGNPLLFESVVAVDHNHSD